jgi:membrane-bound hydrogenase subunit mbhJ
VRKLYAQAAKPCLVIAVGTCACGQGMFHDSYATTVPLDEVLPGAVAAYVPGCPPKPEAIILGVVKALGRLKGK